MDFSDHLVAEQTIYAYLNVDKQKPEQTTFQRSVDVFYKYSKDLYTKLTDADPAEFSITNLPDTIAFLPQNSIFSNILMIRKEDPDFRFVPISETRDVFERNMLPTIVSDETLTMFAPKTETPRKSMFMNTLPSDSPASILQTTNPLNLVYDDPDFSGLKNLEALPNYQTLVSTVRDIVEQSPESTTNDTWVASVFALYPINSNDLRTIISNENTHLNRTTIKYRIINSFSTIIKTNQDREEQFVEIKNLVDNYVAQLGPIGQGQGQQQANQQQAEQAAAAVVAIN
ncbi:putative transposase [Mauternbach virus]|uniref:Putative transposase n=1 Tax=Mauternbach virus TaxID=2486603 RepID=A0A3G3E669_9VIRU|nr:putative transposase [Mauternbach virus]AYP97947.1 putative transposase [Mauternbach virus]